MKVYQKISFLLIILLSLSSFSTLAQVSPLPGQGVPIPNPGFTQVGNTCQQGSYAMVIAALGLFTGTMSPQEIYEYLAAAYSGTSSRNCFYQLVMFLLNHQKGADIVITGPAGGPGRDVIYMNKTLGDAIVNITYTSTSSSGPHPTDPVPAGSLRITSVTWRGNWNGHNIIVQSVDTNNCFPLPGFKTARGTRVMNPQVCPAIYWDPNTDSLIQSFISSDGAYILINGNWEHVISTATVTPH
tara:strand:+ start:894 stop:1619 length:726 start_codon:yes stop_codon:yes gene_type:complete